MASAILHIKDSYYFDVPKRFWRSERETQDAFPDFWVRLDPEFQLWEAELQYEVLEQLATPNLPAWPELRSRYVSWKASSHGNFGKPFNRFLAEDEEQTWFAEATQDARWVERWETGQASTASLEDYNGNWSQDKIEGYNKALDGKILIPQPFARLKNLYEPESGFALSRFMIVELLVALILVAVFCLWVTPKAKKRDIPRGRMWNLLESILLFLRDQVARPAIGHHADRFVPLLWTIFVFILGCNLMGMVPWAGAPTGAFSVTLAMAAVTFFTGWVFGIIEFGPRGILYAQLIPKMDLPIYMAIVLKPMIWAIELLGTVIKHGVLGVRLLANMVAGHVVLLGIMTLAFSAEGAASRYWGLTAVIAIVSSTLFSCLELFVAFLQAYIFTFLSALFIGAATHEH